MKPLLAAILLWAAPVLAQGAEPPAGQTPPLEAPATLAVPVAAPPALAVPVAAPPAPPPPVFATTRVSMKTSMGTIVLALEKQRAPLTTANFLKYVDQKIYDGTGFYRAMKLPGEGTPGLVQAGTRGNPKLNLPPVAHEPTSRTGLSHTDGVISMARLAPGTAAGDFFIIIGNLPSLDAQPAGKGDTAGFAAFGTVVEGMDVVRKIQAAPISPTEGVGVMKGQMLAAPVKILTIRRLK